MKRPNPSRVRANPRHRVRACLQAGAHVQLQHDGRLGIPGKDFDGALIFDGSELALMIVIAGFQTGGLELIGGEVQRFYNSFPAVQTRFRVRRGHHHIFAAENQVHVAGPADFFLTQIGTIVVCRETTDAQVLQKLSRLLGLTLGPFEIRRIKLDALIAHLSDGSNGGLRVLFQLVSNGIKFEPDWDGSRISGRKSPRQDCGKCKKGTAGQGWCWHCRILLENWCFSTAFYESFLCIDGATEPGYYSFTAADIELRPGTIPLTITYRTGMKIRFSVVAAIMPPKTVVPTEMRPARPAPRAKTSGTTPRINARDVIKIGRSRILAASTAASTTDMP